jgi:hypothetical protein
MTDCQKRVYNPMSNEDGGDNKPCHQARPSKAQAPSLSTDEQPKALRSGTLERARKQRIWTFTIALRSFYGHEKGAGFPYC